jgi:PKD repeat protein
MKKNKTNRVMGYAALIIITLMCSTANAFEVSITNTGKEIKWFNLTVPYSINAASGPYGSLNAIKAAMQTWTNVAGADLNFLYAGTTSSTAWGVNDGKNIVCFGSIAESGVLAQNILWYNSSTGQTLDSDIEFNTNFPWETNGSSNSYDVQNVGTHEFGHSVGLADLYAAADSEKTMYGYSSKGETKQRTLEQDDINGIIYLYGNNNTSSSTTAATSTTSSVATTSIPSTTIPVTTTTSIPPFREVAFAGSPVSGNAPLTVTFNNLSQGDIVYQYWDFGDGSAVSFDLNPIHKYRKLGTFTVTLIAGFVDGSTQQMIKENYISVASQCLFVSTLKDQAHINKIRQLRTALRDNLYWRELSIIYYRHFFEVVLIFKQHLELRDELQRLVSNQIETMETLSTEGEATIREDELEEMIAFLLQIKEHGSSSLQADIDSVIAGVNHTMLLEGLGINRE